MREFLAGWSDGSPALQFIKAILIYFAFLLFNSLSSCASEIASVPFKVFDKISSDLSLLRSDRSGFRDPGFVLS